MNEESLFGWLCCKESQLLQGVYQDCYVATGLYRWLPAAAQAVVLHQLCCPPGAPATPLAAQIALANKRDLIPAQCLGILTSTGSLNAAFREGLAKGLASGGRYTPPGGLTVSKAGGGAPVMIGSPDGAAQWEAVLRLLLPGAGSAEGGDVADKHRKLLKRGGYLTQDTGKLTVEGFRFLMLPPPQQVWAYVLLWLGVFLECTAAAAGKKASNKVAQLKPAVVMMLLSFGFHEDGKWYDLPRTLGVVIQQLAEAGLAYVDVRAGKYQVTPLGKAVVSPEQQESLHGEEVRDGNVIVETNNRVYTYTSDPFKIDMLSVFAEVEFTTPGMAVGRLTRESLQNAFSRHITAQQIIAYLENNAHPEMRKGGYRGAALLPDTVVDQILSWEGELRRMSFRPAVLVTAPPSQLAAFHSLAVSKTDDVDSAILASGSDHLVLTPQLHEKIK